MHRLILSGSNILKNQVNKALNQVNPGLFSCCVYFAFKYSFKNLTIYLLNN